jgi:hypothetical protein
MTEPIQTAQILNCKANVRVEAQIVALEDQHLRDFSVLWQPQLHLTLEEDRHWDWIKKSGAHGGPNYERYALVCDGVTQGLMELEVEFHTSSLTGGTLIYVGYLNVAPWNRPEIQDSRNRLVNQAPMYRGAGSALFTLAVLRSFSFGYKGRVGLHSLPRAEGFYRRLSLRDLGEDLQCQNLRYFELTKEHAAVAYAHFAGTDEDEC